MKIDFSYETRFSNIFDSYWVKSDLHSTLKNRRISSPSRQINEKKPGSASIKLRRLAFVMSLSRRSKRKTTHVFWRITRLNRSEATRTMKDKLPADRSNKHTRMFRSIEYLLLSKGVGCKGERDACLPLRIDFTWSQITRACIRKGMHWKQCLCRMLILCVDESQSVYRPIWSILFFTFTMNLSSKNKYFILLTVS